MGSTTSGSEVIDIVWPKNDIISRPCPTMPGPGWGGERRGRAGGAISVMCCVPAMGKSGINNECSRHRRPYVDG